MVYQNFSLWLSTFLASPPDLQIDKEVVEHDSLLIIYYDVLAC